jgi:hypothetical protein
MTRLAYLPLDDRPVNFDYPCELARLAGIEVDLPDRSALGNPWRSSRHTELVDWLEDSARHAEALLVAVDTLGYGGLIPSRTSPDTAERVLERLSVLKRLKAAKPDLPILAYSVILRICRADSAEEEKDYWSTYGSRMFRLSYLEHKAALGDADPAEIEEQHTLHVQIPDPIYEDYRKGRQRNHAVNRAMLDWVAEGILDYLILPQDDTAEYGWNIAEARRLQALIRQSGLSDRAITYPGADETACLLLARYACQQAGFQPRLWLRYSSHASPHTLTAYEDRPMHEMVKAHLAPLGGCLAPSPEQSDIQLFINAPAEGQGAAELQTLIAAELAGSETGVSLPRDESYRRTQREMTTPRRSVEEFVRAVQAAQADGGTVALADVAFVNGADLFLGRRLMETGLAPHLAAYAGWNTAGNTLGTVLAHAVLHRLMQQAPSHPERNAGHLAFLFRRYLDDYFYQTLVRTDLAFQDLPALGLKPGMERLPNDKLPEVEARLKARLGAAAGELGRSFVGAGLVRRIAVDHFRLPWQRLFEVGFDVSVELA